MVIVIDAKHNYDDQPGDLTDEDKLGDAPGRDLQDPRRTRRVRQRRPDPGFQWVAKAIDIAHGAGIDKVGLMTAKVEAGQ